MRALTAWLAAFFLLSEYAVAATIEATITTPAGNPVEDAAVVVEPLSPSVSGKRKIVSIEQRDREFSSYVTIVQAGTPIDFPNHDSLKHHVYSFSQAKPFEIKLYAGKLAQPLIFDKPGEVAIGCNIHDWMETHVLVVNSPYFAKSGSNGRAVIHSVPAGRYRLRLWHPRQKSQQAPGEIELDNASSRLTLILDVKPRDIKPKPPARADHY